MNAFIDGPASPQFRPVPLDRAAIQGAASPAAMSAEMRAALPEAPNGPVVAWGIPFVVDGLVLAAPGSAVTAPLGGVWGAWLVVMHTSDIRPLTPNSDGLYPASRGPGQQGEVAADYVILYGDGSEARATVRRRWQIGAFTRPWGVNCAEAVAHRKPRPVRLPHEQLGPDWGPRQMRVDTADDGPWVNWLWAWQNPHPEREIVGLRIEPVNGLVALAGLAVGEASAHPLRWRTRRKALLRLPEGVALAPELDEQGLLAQVQLDLGQVITARPRALYPTAGWAASYHNRLPEPATREVLIEYTAHANARFVLWNGETAPVSAVEGAQTALADDLALKPVAAATQRVRLRVTDGPGGPAVPCKLHVHGQAGEYLAPVDRHRMPNGAWFEDYSVDFSHAWRHYSTYIPGEATIDLPLGTVYIEISKGFEIRPLRLTREVTPETTEIAIVLEKVLPWRQQGWVTADTHVHFLTPMSALLEGSAEGVNVVNLLASQWGELMTNVGDFDGRSTWGSREMGGDGEHLVRVGTENRQHVMGHISLLGYEGGIIAPMTTGGPDESALGDPIGTLLTEWARQCREQGGLVVLPHFPHPRMENAATIVEGLVDGVEMTSWGDLYSGINPYSLSDWYRYLNNGYLVAAVGGTDKMSATTAVGTVRTYARLLPGEPFTYAAWMEAVRRAETFVTYGPLLDLSVDGQPMGGRMALGAHGGTVDVAWQVASVTVPMSRVELVVNGEIRESVAVDAWRAAGSWSLKVDRSSWVALLVRGHYADRPEIVAAHSSPVMLEVEGSAFYAAADAVTILEQIEGALAYLDTVGTRAEDRVYKRLRLVLEGAHRRLHNRMHAQGHYHEHTPGEDHAAHH
jgi:hypothetical protein